jgi:hypothetical protein
MNKIECTGKKKIQLLLMLTLRKGQLLYSLSLSLSDCNNRDRCVHNIVKRNRIAKVERTENSSLIFFFQFIERISFSHRNEFNYCLKKKCEELFLYEFVYISRFLSVFFLLLLFCQSTQGSKKEYSKENNLFFLFCSTPRKRKRK